MDFHDLDEARALHGALMEVFVAHTGGRENPQALSRVAQLTDAATNAIEDVECRVAMRGVKSYSQLLFSADGHLGIDAGSLTTALVVEQIQQYRPSVIVTWPGRLGKLEDLTRRLPELGYRLERSYERGWKVYVRE